MSDVNFDNRIEVVQEVAQLRTAIADLTERLRQSESGAAVMLRAIRDAKELYDDMSLSSLELAAKYGPEHFRASDDQCLLVRGELEEALSTTAGKSLLAELDQLKAGGVCLISEERRDQIRKGWTPEHDDGHTDGSLAVVAAICACDGTDATVRDAQFRGDWKILKKWGVNGTSPNRVHLLAIIGALIAAEIERLQRRDKWLSEGKGGAA